ncbi:AraC-type DNA-binding protein [Peptostreptococcaceae bacterium pGA-8]|nr:AraC-type DNA-binding protein [Peptostreptococcaceae bacterium pGA-8]
MHYKKHLHNLGFKPYKNHFKYNSIGNSFTTNNINYTGTYWFYECDEFVINIYDYFIKNNCILELPSPVQISSSEIIFAYYILKANGKCLTTSQHLIAKSVIVKKLKQNNTIHLFLYGGSSFKNISIIFKNKIQKKYNITSESLNTLCDLNIKFKEISVLDHIGKLMREICNCKYCSNVSSIFFEAKAKECLSIILNEVIPYNSIIHEDKIDYDNRIELVAKYIDGNYASNISQKLLQNIALMGGTKLKETFSKAYGMSITEYTQRRRINIAESLLKSNNFDIKTISKLVGYSSHSRFCVIFKRYKGITPLEFLRYCEHCEQAQ